MAGASTRQKSAFSELLRSLAKHMALKRGVTETKVAYGPKAAETVAIYRIDPFYSSLGSADATAPVAHAVAPRPPVLFASPAFQVPHTRTPRRHDAHRLTPAPRPPRPRSPSARWRTSARRRLRRGWRRRRRRWRRRARGKSKDDIDTLKSKIPFKWPGAEMFFFQPSSSQLQQRTVGPADTARAKEINPQVGVRVPAGVEQDGPLHRRAALARRLAPRLPAKVIRDKQLHLLGRPDQRRLPEDARPAAHRWSRPAKEDDKLRHTMAHINEVSRASSRTGCTRGSEAEARRSG